MRLDVTYRNFTGTPTLRERADRKFAKVATHLREPLEAHLICHVEKHRHCVELTINAAGELFQFSEETTDMYQTIDAVMDKAERAAQRHKEKVAARGHTRASEM